MDSIDLGKRLQCVLVIGEKRLLQFYRQGEEAMRHVLAAPGWRKANWGREETSLMGATSGQHADLHAASRSC